MRENSLQLNAGHRRDDACEVYGVLGAYTDAAESRVDGDMYLDFFPLCNRLRRECLHEVEATDGLREIGIHNVKGAVRLREP